VTNMAGGISASVPSRAHLTASLFTGGRAAGDGQRRAGWAWAGPAGRSAVTAAGSA
jgi:hypothetical protein